MHCDGDDWLQSKTKPLKTSTKVKQMHILSSFCKNKIKDSFVYSFILFVTVFFFFISNFLSYILPYRANITFSLNILMIFLFIYMIFLFSRERKRIWTVVCLFVCFTFSILWSCSLEHFHLLMLFFFLMKRICRIDYRFRFFHIILRFLNFHFYFNRSILFPL